MQTDLKLEEIKNLLQTFKPEKQYILQALHLLQDNHPQQYINKSILGEVKKYFNLSESDIYGIVTYYSMFSLKPRGKHIIRLCQSPVCQMMGSKKIEEYLKEKWNIARDKVSNDNLFYLEIVECLGRCGKAPSMMINKDTYTNLDPSKIDLIISEITKTTK